MGSTQDGGGDEAQELWRHPDPKSTPMWRFLEAVNEKHGLKLNSFEDLYQWSIDDVAVFWEDVWHFVGIVASKPFDQVLPPNAPMFPRPDFFSSARLNFAENLLYPATPSPIDPSATAVITATEIPGDLRETSWAELREATRRCANALRAIGIKPHDVVAGYVSNHVEALVAMLAASSIGAVWTGISPDTGVSAVLDRLGQIAPRVLFADNGAVYNGKEWPSTSKTLEIVAPLAASGLERVVIINNISADLGTSQIEHAAPGVSALSWDAFLGPNKTKGEEENDDDAPLVFEQLPPSHPLYILYSSGTTGLPKAIVHTALGTLIQHKKEHVLHCSLDSSSRMLYYTTTSWMMWHWTVSALAAGTTLVLYSGSPFRPHAHLSLPRLLSALRVTHFGTSAAYLTTLEANAVFPLRGADHKGQNDDDDDDDDDDKDDAASPPIDLSALKAIYSTASPLPPSTFHYVYSAFPKTVNLASITGGTDIISLFGAPCPLLPVRPGQIQCAGLGMAIRAVDSLTGAALPDPALPGDLICVRPFPSQPLTFFGSSGDAKYRAAYFERFPSNPLSTSASTSTSTSASTTAPSPPPTPPTPGPVWHHGDFIRIPDPRTGSLIMLGRSDGVLKPAGVRFGSAEIYNILIRFFPSDVADAVCVGRRRPHDPDETVCLFLLMLPGRPCSDALKAAIRSTIKTELSPRHVPGVIDECAGGIPKTGNGKKIEVAVKQILSGMDITTNASVANPEALEWFKQWAKTH